MKSTDLASNYEFPSMVSDWTTYNSSRDKTNVSENVWVRGSKNVYKKLSGTIAVRPGQKRIGAVNTTLSPCSSSFVWNTSWGATYTTVVSNSNLYVIIDDVWYSLASGLTRTRYVFDKWWDNVEKKDRLLFVNGSDDMQWWSGGYTTVDSSTANTITKNDATSWFQAGFTKETLTTIGSSTSQFDITNTAGTTYRYTWDGTGTDPAITATSVPVGTYVLIGAQNFTAANNGLFTVTNSGANFFEVTNASGVVESNKTIGTGFIYTNFNQVVIIGGTAFAYTGGQDTTTLTGVTPDASAITVDATALQAVITVPNTPASNFSNDFLKVINNQVYLGSYTSRLCYISKNTDFTDFVVPTPRQAGDPELLTMDGTLNGISVRQGNAYISFGTDSWAAILFRDITVGTTLTQSTTVDIKPVAVNQAAYSHEMISSVGDNIVYLAKDQQIRVVGDFNNAFTPRYPSLSQAIATELEQETFTSGSLSCIGEFIYVTAPNTGNVYLRQERTNVDNNGNAILEIIWHSPFIWNLTSVNSINGVVVGFSNANPQIYQLWDTEQWHDDSPSEENLPYTCIFALGYRGGKRRQGMWSFDKVFSEGYITQGTTLNLRINYNYQGASGVTDAIVNSPTRPAYLFTPNAGTASSLGDESLGDESLGGSYDSSSSEVDEFPKFKNINSVNIKNCFEWQPIFFSDTADSRWEILATATNAEVEKEENAVFLINKLRT